MWNRFLERRVSRSLPLSKLENKKGSGEKGRTLKRFTAPRVCRRQDAGFGGRSHDQLLGASHAGRGTGTGAHILRFARRRRGRLRSAQIWCAQEERGWRRVYEAALESTIQSERCGKPHETPISRDCVGTLDRCQIERDWKRTRTATSLFERNANEPCVVRRGQARTNAARKGRDHYSKVKRVEFPVVDQRG